MHWPVFFQIDFCLCLAQISESLTSMINRTARGQLQGFYPKLLINGSKQSNIGIYQYIPSHSHHFLLTKIIEYEHKLLQLVEDSMSFTDFIDVKSEYLESLYISSVQMKSNCCLNLQGTFDSWVFKLVPTMYA